MSERSEDLKALRNEMAAARITLTAALKIDCSTADAGALLSVLASMNDTLERYTRPVRIEVDGQFADAEQVKKMGKELESELGIKVLLVGR